MDITDLIPKFGPIVGTAFTLILVSVGLITYDINTKNKEIDNLKGKLSAEDITTIKNALSKFPRNSLSNRIQMYEESIPGMVLSLNELRIDLNKSGINSLPSSEIKDLLSLIKDDLEKVLYISMFLKDTSNYSNNLIDLRSFGQLDTLNSTYTDLTTKQNIELIYQEFNGYLKTSLQRHGYNTELSKDITYVYFFGKIDELKESISQKINLIQILLDKK